jgi:tetratricopeptide (TPR) repeat protein
VREHAPELPAAAARALARGMARDPAERPATAGELAAELAIALGPTERPVPTAATTPIRTAPPPPAPARRARSLAGPLAIGLIALAVGAVVAAILLAGGGGDQPRERAQTPAQTAPEPTQTEAESPPSETTPTDTTPAEPPASDPQQATNPARGVQLNEQGFALMGQGDYAGAVPILRQAVASWPDNSTDVNYAYALYNLGKSLNRSGSAAEAIPYLEQRLNWPNQRGVVKQELRLARQNAGQG